ncbi:hypothetical protein BJL95_19795 [Methylomonas sp. LWB]|nr:hypothetical protein BJL95_19795 [Methylomonas sp. LWB]
MNRPIVLSLIGEIAIKITSAPWSKKEFVKRFNKLLNSADRRRTTQRAGVAVINTELAISLNMRHFQSIFR